jgi:GH35 family endo-1,4-beta-xylanase
MSRFSSAEGKLCPARPSCYLFVGILIALFFPRILLAQATLTGSSMALQSLGSATLSDPGYLGTYLTVPAGGATINFTARATRGASGNGVAPHMNLVIADSRFAINVASTSATNYTTPNVTLPAGMYFVRAERDYDNSSASTSAFTLNNLTVNTTSGASASFSNASSNTNAFAAADTYINNFRKGQATVRVIGASPGTPVSVNLKRLDFSFGDSIDGFTTSGVNTFLGNNGTTQQTKFQQTLNQNFNALSGGNIGKWAHDEATQNAVTMGGVDAYLNYAQAHNMAARVHNLIWGPTSATGSQQQPNWVVNLLNNAAAGDAAAKTNLSNAITNRINYYVGGSAKRSLKYGEIDVYNESYHTGQNNAYAGNYWDIYGAAGIASIYNQVAASAAAAGSNAKTFVNEYNVLQNNGTNYGTFYFNHINDIRDAGGSVGGIGVQYYPTAANGTGAGSSQHNPARIVSTLQNLSVEGLPIVLTEFGVGGTAPTDTVPNPDTMANATTILADTMRLVFGTPQATGFYMWGFHSENNNGANPGSNLFAKGGALYAVNTANWNTWTITNAGKIYEDLLGVKEWDGTLGNGWNTQLDGKTITDGNGNLVGNNPAAPLVDASGNVNFNGFYGDYVLTIGGKTYPLDLQTGITNYTIVVPEPSAVLLSLCGLTSFAWTRSQFRSRRLQ